MKRSIAILALVSALNGCAAIDRFERALEEAGVARFQVRPTAAGTVLVSTDPAGRRGGCGAVVGRTTVLTVDHVVPGVDRAFVRVGSDGGWREARVRERIPARPEPLVVLELEAGEGALEELFGFTGFEPDRQLEQRAGAAPATVALARGTWRWGTPLEPGDSGAPVLDAEGGLVGLVSGRREGRGVFVPIPAGLPADGATFTCLRPQAGR